MRTTILMASLAGAAIIAALLPYAHVWGVHFYEQGLTETASALFLAAAALVLAIFYRPSRAIWHIVVLVALLANREADERQLSGLPVLAKVTAYVDDVLLENTVIVIALLLFLLAGFLRYTWPLMRDRAFWRSDILAILATGTAFAAGGQIADVIGAQGNGTISAVRYAKLHLIEEISELWFAVAVFCASVLAVLRRRRPNAEEDNAGDHSRNKTANPGTA
ncbi:hypothetical protein [Roseobacter ponti]|uniref:Uncharacterized protein n=1 Tax=Roseobacter ponti TaxID=1891787 RepID=A0A858SW01_9RHOB|nr:hypothetical protein [Roseobacter ponti]QJF52197.1 hypothetical protein G3256_13950 [Roseobacter ponti]